MIEFAPCHPEHVVLVAPQAEQRADAAALLSPLAASVLASTVALSGFVGPRCVGCAGVVDTGPDNALVWALLSNEVGPCMLAVSRKVSRVLAAYPARRIEAHVVRGFGEGERWVRMLGFKPDAGSGITEAVRAQYAAYGKEIDVYSLVKE